MYIWTSAKAACKSALKAQPKRVIQVNQNLLVITSIAAFAFEQSPFFVWVSSLPCTDVFLIWMPTPNSSGPPLHSTSLNKACHSSLYSIVCSNKHSVRACPCGGGQHGKVFLCMPQHGHPLARLASKDIQYKYSNSKDHAQFTSRIFFLPLLGILGHISIYG